MSETDVQIACADYLNARGVLWNHCPNEGRMKPQYGAKRKRMGVSAGVPDIMIYDKPPAKPEFVGVAIELKVDDNMPTTEQERWLESLFIRNWYVDVCYGVDEAVRLFKRLGW